jgi:hypothetical protein
VPITNTRSCYSDLGCTRPSAPLKVSGRPPGAGLEAWPLFVVLADGSRGAGELEDRGRDLDYDEVALKLAQGAGVFGPGRARRGAPVF